MTNLALIAILLRLLASCLTAEETSQGSLIAQWDQASLKRGEERYAQTCQICHGTVAEVGQFPDALRFRQGKFKNGAAPHEMFQTIKHGFGQFMPAHPSMSNQEIYDVIHFLRERFVKPHNPSQYVKIDETYLAKASTMKLVAQQNKLPPWLMMDYGPTMSATYNLGAYSVMKGIAVRLDPGHGGVTKGRSWILFD
ncbi:cytochrome c, partial [Akkermansiaceae bacterium]|nr:cytochrome c [Akkermansiaceae bacterium]